MSPMIMSDEHQDDADKTWVGLEPRVRPARPRTPAPRTDGKNETGSYRIGRFGIAGSWRRSERS